MDDVSLRISQEFAGIVARGTYDWVNVQLKKVGNARNVEEQRILYQEIVETLLSEKSELQNITRQYKDLYEQVNIKPNDIDLLKKTVRRVIQLFTPEINEDQIFNSLLEQDYSEEEAQKQLEQYKAQVQNQIAESEKIIELIDYDTLQTMQLLGFSYKDAIGKPLTDACANLIREKIESSSVVK